VLNLDNAVVYDIETFPNVFTLNALGLFSDLDITFEISHFRDDRHLLLQWFAYWQDTCTPMIGFNNLTFDYPVIHEIFTNPSITVDEIYQVAVEILAHANFNRFGRTVWGSDRFAPQIDLFKIHHFDNRAKSTSLKALQISMRSESVVECPLEFNVPLTRDQVTGLLIPYNKHDVRETKKFALISLDAIKFRLGLMAELRGDVLNFNDTKIGAKILEHRLGDDICYESTFVETDFQGGGYKKKTPRQTFRPAIRLNDIILPYIQFQHPEFNRVLTWMRQQVLTPDELSESQAIRTKGVFTGVRATVGGLDFHFGTGGIHGSVTSRRYQADAERAIVDIDVTGLYPSIAIVNGLYPEHLGQRFVEEYAKLPQERAKHKKGTVQNAALKLAANGTYGNSNNAFSVFYDPRFTMAITINGQLLLCMLAEWLLSVPTLEIVQINTDGITYRVHPSLVPYTRRIRSMWENTTRLQLEEAHYGRMWIRDVNNYIAETTDGKLKQKGAYWFPRKFPDDIANSSPPAWHKDFSAVVSTKAAVEHMVHGVDIARFVYGHSDPFDFMLRAKVDRSSKLLIGDREVQRITRYYVATNGGPMRKLMPPPKGAAIGEYKRRNGISEYEYVTVLNSIPPGTWDSRIHTKNKSRYTVRETGIEAGHLVADCSNARAFDFANLKYDYYIENARKLVIP
jgi:hypothetical protein